MKTRFISTLIIISISVLAFSQSYMEGPDLSNTAPGPTFTFISPDITISGQMNTPDDGNEYFEIELSEGCQIDAVHYSITDPNSLTITGFFQFGTNNQETFSGATLDSFENATQFPSNPFPLLGPATLQCQVQANIAFLSDWEMIFTGSCGCAEPTVPTVTASSNSICPGESATLNISGMLNNATAWQIYTDACGGTNIGSTDGTTFDVSPAESTTYFIRGEGGCATPGNCASVTIENPNNVIDISVTQNDNLLIANNTPASYQWIDCNNDFVLIQNDTLQTCLFCQTNMGNYAVILMEGNCADTSSCFSVDITGTIENTFDHNIMVYPNPSNGNISIDFGQVYENICIRIFDVGGSLVIEMEKTERTTKKHLEVEFLPRGIYLLQMISEGLSFNQKIVLQ